MALSDFADKQLIKIASGALSVLLARYGNRDTLSAMQITQTVVEWDSFVDELNNEEDNGTSRKEDQDS